MSELEDIVNYDPKYGPKIERSLLLKEQAARLLEMTDLWQEFEKGAEYCDAKADMTIGEEHQRHVGAKIALREWMAQVKRLAAFQVPKQTKAGNNYA